MSDDSPHPREDWRPDVPCLTVAEFLERSAREPWMIVDCRRRNERLVSVLPGSVSLSQFRFQRARRKGRPLLLYCTVGRRSGVRVRQLRKRELPAYNLQGGVLAWAAARQPLVTLDGLPTLRVHVRGRPASTLPAGYQAVGAA